MAGEAVTAGLATTQDSPNKDAFTRPDSPKARLTPAEISRIIPLAQAGMSCRAIGELLGRHHSTISSALEDLADTVSPAQLLAKARAYEVQQKRIALIADYDQATDFLEREGIVAAKQAGQSGPQVAVFIGDGQSAIGNAPTFACSTQAVSVDMHSLSGATGSDNGGYVVNQPAPAGQAPAGGSALDPAGGPYPAVGCGMEPENFPSQSATE